MSTKFTKSSKTPPSFLESLRSVLTDPTRAGSQQLISPYTSAGFGGVAEYLVVVETATELLAVLQAASKERISYTVLGGGTGILTSAVGCPGLIIVNRSAGIVFGSEVGEVVVESGLSTVVLANALSARGYGGLEAVAVIPGSIGGAVATNATYEGQGVFDCLKEAVVYRPTSGEGETAKLSAAELWANRRLFFDQSGFGPVILSLRFRLRQTGEEEARRKLTVLRQRSPRYADRSFGGILTPAPTQPVWASLRLRLPRGLEIDRRVPNALCVRGSSIQPPAVRQAVTTIYEALRASGYEGEPRLRYIGYWPNEEINDVTQSPNA